ncbi:hypothetical protein [Chelativorans sp. AA-79]|uniref:hypothetical protein n=1 Tax=Chelativorans sp. AA-79 TaxID=3028735 RepID=UPI0023F8A739|nr:hypothetical protein [Chelativorans sp. AA-79]WEX07103.1 hypothetical protein PVE73_13230 [Chelativorans sp. AA-79]
MSEEDRNRPRKRADVRAILIAAAIIVVVLILFLLYGGGFGTAPDTTSGGADPDSIPTQAEETAPTTGTER